MQQMSPWRTWQEAAGCRLHLNEWACWWLPHLASQVPGFWPAVYRNMSATEVAAQTQDDLMKAQS